LFCASWAKILSGRSEKTQQFLNVADKIAPAHLYEFGRFRIDTADRLLMRGGAAAPLQPKVIDTLVRLIEV
jgi:hypothetical protein